MGGLVAINKSEILGCVSTVDITGSVGANGGGFTGGLVGVNEGDIAACYFRGSIALLGTNGSGVGVGGLVGFMKNGTIIGCYSAGTFGAAESSYTNDSGKGGCLGRFATGCTVVTILFDVGLAPGLATIDRAGGANNHSSAGATPTADMLQQGVVNALNVALNGASVPEAYRFSMDFEDPDSMNAGYPILDWQASGGDEGDEEDEGEGDSEEEEQNQGGASQVTVPSVTCTVGADPGGSITASYNSGSQQTVVHIPVEDASGARLQITVTPDPGYLLKDVLVGGVKLNGVPARQPSGV
ncbi:hypothetical protein FACS1894198_0940 [Clostridia bacterium]|nr:hypothetical protein FACS1894198_0940 [Clostridia bacterium]